MKIRIATYAAGITALAAAAISGVVWLMQEHPLFLVIPIIIISSAIGIWYFFKVVYEILEVYID